MNASTIKTLALASGVLLAGVLAGCGWFDGDDAASSPSALRSAPGSVAPGPQVTSPLRKPRGSFFVTPSAPTRFRGPLRALPGMNLAYGIYPSMVVPACGPLSGGTAVMLLPVIGDTFPLAASLTAVQASYAYYIYFGEVRRPVNPFDSSFNPGAATQDVFHVLTPVGPRTGLVDVTVYSVSDGFYGNLTNAFSYYEPLEIDSINPISGPMSGFTQVRLTSPAAIPFPIHAASLTAATASLYYRVLFDSLDATFVDVAGAAITYTDAYVLAPPFPIPDTVDVTILEIGNACNSFTLPNSYTYTGLDIQSLTEPLGYTRGGFVNGGMPIRLDGAYPIGPAGTTLTVAQAAAGYQVIFHGASSSSIAQFIDDPLTGAFDDAMTATKISVAVPAYPCPEVVAVTVSELNSPLNADTLLAAFEYVALEILQIDPARGTTSGGTLVTVTAFISTASNIDTIAGAYSAYRIFFDGFPAAFNVAEPDLIVAPQPNTKPDNTLPLNDLVTQAGRFYVVTPPHAAGLVDVLAEDLNLNALCAISSTYTGFTYVDSEVGDWVGLEIVPEFIGRLDAGEVTLRVETTAFPAAAADWGNISVFIVPQGGDASVADHRIAFDLQGAPDTSGVNVVTTWTNANDIETIVFESPLNGIPETGDLFADGHAAVYIDANGTILGADYVDLTDGGLIQNGEQILDFGALFRRHVLIDTLPPVMVANPDPSIADDIVTLNSGMGVLSDIAPAPLTQEHPAPLPGAVPQENDPAPSDAGLIDSSVSGPPFGTGAQIFVNVSSDDDTNMFASFYGDDALDITVEVTYQDIDLHTYYGIAQDPVWDEDLFNPGTTFRQPSGLSPSDMTTRLDKRVGDSLFLGGAASAWVQWLLTSDSDRMRPSLRVGLLLTSNNTEPGLADIPEFASDPNYVNDFTAKWDFVTTLQPGGIPQLPGSNPLHWGIQFRAHDRAGRVVNGFLADTPPVIRRIMTYPEALLDPLHIWWIRRTSARLDPNLEGKEVFDPTISFELVPGYDPQADGLPPLFSYNLWQSTVPGMGGYDTEYEQITGWTNFEVTNSIQPQTVFPVTARNHWVLVAVLGIDEAGNYGQFPNDELAYDFLGAGNITDFLSGSGASWMRFFLKDQPGFLDTRIKPRFWYNNLVAGQGNLTVDPGEIEIRGAPVIVQEATQPGTELRVEFTIEPILGDPGLLNSAEIFWKVISPPPVLPGATIRIQNTYDVDVMQRDGNTVKLQFSQSLSSGFGGWAQVMAPLTTRPPGTPTTYTFHFATVSGTETDSTPASYSFTVVPDIEKYIENRDSRDHQPLKETER